MSQLNASEWLCLSTLFQGGISCFLELGPLWQANYALDVVLSRGMLSVWSGEGCCLLGLGDCSGAGAGVSARVDGFSTGEAPSDKVKG